MATLDHGPVVSDEKVVVAACKDAQQLLTEHYYSSWDQPDRKESVLDASGQAVVKPKLWKLYHEKAAIVWNGQALTRDTIDTVVDQMPATKHTITSLDVQPLAGSSHSLLSVHGSCKYDNAISRTFHQQFVIWKEEGVADGLTRYWVMHDCLRWTSEENAG